MQELLKKMFPTDGSRSSEFILLILMVVSALLFVLFKGYSPSDAFSNLTSLTMAYIGGRSFVKGINEGVKAWKGSSKETSSDVGPLDG